jgi:hypothetical protein
MVPMGIEGRERKPHDFFDGYVARVCCKLTNS